MDRPTLQCTRCGPRPFPAVMRRMRIALSRPEFDGQRPQVYLPQRTAAPMLTWAARALRISSGDRGFAGVDCSLELGIIRFGMPPDPSSSHPPGQGALRTKRAKPFGLSIRGL